MTKATYANRTSYRGTGGPGGPATAARRTPCLGRITVAILVVAAQAAVARAECGTTICTGSNPCTVSGTHTLDANCSIDWGCSQDVVVTGTITGGPYTLNAHSFDVQGTLRAQGDTNSMTVTTCGTGNPFFKTRSVSNSNGTIDVGQSGSATITAVGTLDLLGKDVAGDGATGACTGGDVDVTGTVVSITSPMHVDGACSGGLGDGGTISVTSTTGSVSMTGNGQITANGGAGGGFGGSLSVDAFTTITAAKAMQAKGAGGGDGGSIDLLSETTGTSGLATVSGALNTSGAGGDSSGGAISIDAGAVTDSSTITDNAGSFGFSDVSISATGGDISVTGTIDANGSGGGDGGDIAVSGDRNVTIDAALTADGSGTDSSGGTIDVDGGTNHTLEVRKTLEAKSTSSNGFFDGDVFIGPACTVSVTSTGAAKTRNTSVGLGANHISYQGTFTTVGTLQADDPAPTDCAAASSGNVVKCRCIDTSPADGVCDTPLTCASSPSLGGTITPSPALVCPTIMPACG